MCIRVVLFVLYGASALLCTAAQIDAQEQAFDLIVPNSEKTTHSEILFCATSCSYKVAYEQALSSYK